MIPLSYVNEIYFAKHQARCRCLLPIKKIADARTSALFFWEIFCALNPFVVETRSIAVSEIWEGYGAC